MPIDWSCLLFDRVSIYINTLAHQKFDILVLNQGATGNFQKGFTPQDDLE